MKKKKSKQVYLTNKFIKDDYVKVIYNNNLLFYGQILSTISKGCYEIKHILDINIDYANAKHVADINLVKLTDKEVSNLLKEIVFK